MANVVVSASMEDGTGLGMKVFIDGTVLFFDHSATQTVDLDPGPHLATVMGHEPSSSDVVVQFLEGNEAIGQQTYSSPTFGGFIKFTVI